MQVCGRLRVSATELAAPGQELANIEKSAPVSFRTWRRSVNSWVLVCASSTMRAAGHSDFTADRILSRSSLTTKSARPSVAIL